MTARPRVTVLMPVYNATAYLKDAVASVLRQTYADFELLIIDDGSTDNGPVILETFTDPRIRLIRNRNNQGLIATLNEGLEQATGQDYLARMDADDVCLPDRLERQVRFMDENPSVGLCGSWLESFGTADPQLWSPPVDDAGIRCSLLFESVIYHPTVLFRKTLLDDAAVRYAPDYPHAEDYELWTRLMDQFRFANIDQVLLRYRLHADSVGAREASTQQRSADRVRQHCLRRLGIDPTEAELALHSAIARWRVPPRGETLQQAHDWLVRLIETNRTTGVFPPDAFSLIVAQRWFQTCFNATAAGVAAYRQFSCSALGSRFPLTLRQRLLLMIRSALKIS